MQRKVSILLLLLLMMGSTACRVTNRAVNRIFFPEPTEVAETTAPTPEMQTLATNLSKVIGLKLNGTEDMELYTFIADWRHVPYRYGSYSMKGTDCSGFVYNLYKSVYAKDLGRTSSQGMLNQCNKIPKSELKEGDLVFFNINNRRGGAASHVGVYLKDNRFVHSATRSGITISSLNDPYYKRHFMTAGRVRE